MLNELGATMVDRLLDTNVLIVASAARHLDPRFADVVVGVDAIDTVFRWLADFRADTNSAMVLDELFNIYDEYRNKLQDQHYGLLVVHEKMNQMRQVSVTYDSNGYGCVPAALHTIDNSDKKFVAAALNDPENIHIVNAVDSDWAEQAAVLRAHGIVVEELL